MFEAVAIILSSYAPDHDKDEQVLIAQVSWRNDLRQGVDSVENE
jgi:hypothetical protein